MPRAIEDPFYLMFPEWSLIPVILLATAATIIASQAVITGAFSLVSQAIHLGFLPRMDIHHTSHTDTGQIYLPMVNTFLLFGVMMLVLIFQTSNRSPLPMASRDRRDGGDDRDVLRLPPHRMEMVACRGAGARAAARHTRTGVLGANLIKIHDGGYVPIGIAALVVLVMWTWRRGAAIVSEKSRRSHVALRAFVKSIEKKSAHGPHLIPGCGIFLTSEPEATPSALLHNIKHNRVLHQQNIILTIRTDAAPTVPASERGKMERISEHFSLLTLSFGFMDTPNVSQALAQLRKEGLKFDIMSDHLLRRPPQTGLRSQFRHARLQDRLFIGLAGMGTDPRTTSVCRRTGLSNWDRMSACES